MTLDSATAAAIRIVEKYHSKFPEEMENLKLKILSKAGGSPWLFALLMGKLMALADPSEVEMLRRLSLKRWVPLATDYIKDLEKERVEDSSYKPIRPKPQPKGGTPLPKPAKTIIKPQLQDNVTTPVSVTVEGVAEGDAAPDAAPTEPPRQPPLPPAPPSGGGGSGGPDDPSPSWLTEMEQEAYQQARSRAGEYARGLGNFANQRTGQIVKEVWQGEVITRFADKDKREENLALLKEKTAEAIAHGWTADELARRLRNETEDWGRDWERIAETELQGAYNDGVFVEAVKYEGEEARFARVPDGDACGDCKRLFLNPDGTPKIFTAVELDNNGTNVGRKRKDWLPTIWPIHPKCRCDIQVIPPGFELDDEYMLTESKSR